MKKNYYEEKAFTLLIQHGIENQPLAVWKENFQVIEAQDENGNDILIIKPKENEPIQVDEETRED